MNINLDSADIQLLKQIRNKNSHEVAFVIDDQENLLVIHGDDASVHSIPTDKGIIGHTHPFQKNINYNPPSRVDIESCLAHLDRDWFIVDECGIWVYAVAADIDLTDKMIEFICDKADMGAIGVINDLLSVQDYIFRMRHLIQTNDRWVGIDIQYYSYVDTTAIMLQKK